MKKMIEVMSMQDSTGMSFDEAEKLVVGMFTAAFQGDVKTFTEAMTELCHIAHLNGHKCEIDKQKAKHSIDDLLASLRKGTDAKENS